MRIYGPKVMCPKTALLKALCPTFSVSCGSACAVRTPSDLTLESVETIDYYGLPKLPPLGDWIRYEDGEEIVMFDQRAFKVSFSSAHNLMHFQTGLRVRLFLSAYFCERPHDAVRLDLHGIYWREKKMDKYDERLSARLRKGKDNLFVYQVYLFAQRFEGEDGPFAVVSTPTYISFDLRRNPEDVCFHLYGANYDFEHKSNVIRIPAAMIRDALANEPPGLSK